MWMITVFLSVVFCAAGYIIVLKKNTVVCWAPAGSLAFVSLTLLVEHRMVLAWVVKEDWSALLDVIPGMFSISAAYVITLFVANACLISMARKKH